MSSGCFTPEGYERKRKTLQVAFDNFTRWTEHASLWNLLREQINIRKKVLKQKVKIPFTHNQKQRQLKDIIQELSDFIAMNSEDVRKDSEILTPEFLVGKFVHKFEVEDEEK